MNAANFAVRWHTRLAAPESGDYTFSVDMDHRGGTTIVLDGEVLGKASECDTVTAQNASRRAKSTISLLRTRAIPACTA